MKIPYQYQLSQFRDWIFQPPYYGVPWIVWFYALFCCLCVTSGGVFTGLLTGYDDHTRMVQILDWVNGAGWYDRTITRVNAPEGFTTIWTHLVDIPYAFVILILQNFIGQRSAALVSAFIIPLAELGILFSVARYFARPLVGKDRARLIILFLMFTTVMNYRPFSMSGFYTGEASHHSWYVILTLLLFGAVGRLVLGVAGPKPAIIMGIAAGLLPAVGIEGFPLIAGAVIIVAIIAWLYSRPALAMKAMQAMVFAAMLSLLLLPLHQPPEKLFILSFAEPSILGPILLAFAALFLLTEQLALQNFPRNKKASLAIAVLSAAALAGALIWLFPQILDGPAAALTPSERAMVFHDHDESKPLYKLAENAVDLISLIAPILIALITGAYAIYVAPTRRYRAVCIAYFGFAFVAGAMGNAIARYYHHSLTTACAWLLWAWEYLKLKLKRNRSYSLAALGLFVVIGPFWMLLLPAMNDDGGLRAHVLMFPAKVQSFHERCNVVNIGQFLNQHYGKDARLLVPGIDSSRMLYYSDLKIDFLNNYPSHDKFIDNETFFGTQDTNVAKDIARRHKVDLVGVCYVPGVLPPLQPGEEPMMFERLQQEIPPSWLKEVNTGMWGYFRLYEVDKKALSR